jgi:hypothetical protein
LVSRGSVLPGMALTPHNKINTNTVTRVEVLHVGTPIEFTNDLPPPSSSCLTMTSTTTLPPSPSTPCPRAMSTCSPDACMFAHAQHTATPNAQARHPRSTPTLDAHAQCPRSTPMPTLQAHVHDAHPKAVRKPVASTSP